MGFHQENYSNRRQFQRVGFNSQVAVLHRGEFQFEKNLEIGEGGMRLKVGNEYKIGTLVEICFFISETEYVSAFAEVLYELSPEKEERQIGLRFVLPPVNVQSSIRKYVEKVAAYYS